MDRPNVEKFQSWFRETWEKFLSGSEAPPKANLSGRPLGDYNNFTSFGRRLPEATELGLYFCFSVVSFSHSLAECIAANQHEPFPIPPGTGSLIFLNGLVFLKPNGVPFGDVSLSPYRVIERGEVGRLIKSAFVHMDLPHLAFNMRGLLDYGRKIESLVGPVPLLVDVGTLTVVSQSMYVGAAWVEKTLWGLRSTYDAMGGVGFSSACFALQIMADYVDDDELSNRYFCWLTLGVSHLLSSTASFQGHMCGIAAGLLRVFLPKPFLWVRRKVTGVIGAILGRNIRHTELDEGVLRRRRRLGDLFVHLAWAGVAIAVYLAKGGQSMGGRVQDPGPGPIGIGKCDRSPSKAAWNMDWLQPREGK